MRVIIERICDACNGLAQRRVIKRRTVVVDRPKGPPLYEVTDGERLGRAKFMWRDFMWHGRLIPQRIDVKYR